MTARVEELAEDLRGTCKSIDEACEALGFEFSDLSQTEAEELDDLVFECNCCSWWREISEANENPSGDGDICDDCKGED